MYFITDTQEIYKGKIPVGRAPGEILEVDSLVKEVGEIELHENPQLYLSFKKSLFNKISSEDFSHHIFYSDSDLSIFNTQDPDDREVVYVQSYVTPIVVDRSSYTQVFIVGNGGIVFDTNSDPEDYSGVELKLIAPTWNILT